MNGEKINLVRKIQILGNLYLGLAVTQILPFEKHFTL